MRLYEFIAVDGLLSSDQILIDELFGLEFYVVDEQGHLLTTAQNLNLLRRARLLIEQAASLDSEELRAALVDLAGRMEVVRQSDYDLAARRESPCGESYQDQELGIGSLM